MPLTQHTPTGINFLTRDPAASDGVNYLTQLQYYEKQLGSQGAGGVLFTLAQAYAPGTNTLLVFVNGQKAEADPTPVGQLQYEEVDQLRVQFGSSLISTDVIEFMVLGNYELTDMTQLFMPPGFVFPIVNGNTPPTGTLHCNGAWVSKTTYAALFSGYPLSLGTIYGDSGGNFRLPDYRGRFMRGWAAGSSRDPDRASRTSSPGGSPSGDNVGSYQADGFASHRHAPQPGYSTFMSSSGNTHGRGGDSYGTFGNTAYTGGNETRPKNTYVMWVIKY